MSKIRVYDIAKELGMSSKKLVDEMKKMNMDVTNHMSTIEDNDKAKIMSKFKPAQGKKPEKKVESTHKKEATKSTTTQRPAHKPAQKPAHKPADKKPQTTNKPADKKPQTTNKPADKRPQTSNKPGANKPGAAKPGANKSFVRKNKDFKKRTKQSKKVYQKQKENEKAGIDLTPDSIAIGSTVMVSEFASLVKKAPSEIIMKLMGLGEMVTINASISYDVAEVLCEEYGVKLEKEKTETELNEIEFEFVDNKDDLVFRAPVVTVMGHVDHGKTSLLDAIRNTEVTEGEAGGITQHIGASEVMVNNKKIVFLDTPGHEAFTTLRARGAQVTDIAILVVAADDGVMPQTIEAIDHAQAAGVPIIVAINKIDKVNATPDRVKQELSERGILVEDWGGDVISVELSAITGENVDTLLEMVLLVAEMQELKANPSRAGIGTVIEAKVDKGRGPVATVLVQNGTMSVGDPVFVGNTFGKIRAMISDKGVRLETVGPSSSIEILGLNEVPKAGEKIYVTSDERNARLHAEKNQIVQREAGLNTTRKNVTLEDLFDQIEDGEVKDLNIIIKADVHGSIEALKQSLTRLSNEEVRVSIIHASVGTITESDILLASASNAIIIGFNVRPSNSVLATASTEEVELRTYRIIYEAIKDVKDALSGLLDPDFVEEVEGQIEVRATFKVPDIGTIAGAYVTSGKVSRKSQVRLVREGIVIFEGAISSLKRFKDDAKEVQTGFECGIGLEKYNDLKEGDIIEAFIIKEIKRSL